MVDKMLGDFRQAARSAFEQTAKQLGVPLVPEETHRRAIRNMSAQDLDTLAQTFGQDQVVDYLTRHLFGG